MNTDITPYGSLNGNARHKLMCLDAWPTGSGILMCCLISSSLASVSQTPPAVYRSRCRSHSIFCIMSACKHHPSHHDDNGLNLWHYNPAPIKHFPFKSCHLTMKETLIKTLPQRRGILSPSTMGRFLIIKARAGDLANGCFRERSTSPRKPKALWMQKYETNFLRTPESSSPLNINGQCAIW